MSKYFLLKKRIIKNEGFSQSPYRDQLGFLTIGYGHLIKKNERGVFNQKISKHTLKKLFQNDFNQAVLAYKKNYEKNKFPKNVEEVLIEMIFQLGIKKQKKFKKMQKHLLKKEHHMASLEMIKSLWYHQTPKRVESLISILLKPCHEKKQQR